MERKQRGAVPKRLLLAVAIVAVLGLALLAQNSVVLVPDMDSYSVINQRVITVKVAVAPCSWTRVTNLTETATEIRIRVETLPCPIPLPGTDELSFQVLSVSLVDDLATRVVMDANGHTVRSS